MVPVGIECPTRESSQGRVVRLITQSTQAFFGHPKKPLRYAGKERVRRLSLQSPRPDTVEKTSEEVKRHDAWLDKPQR